MESSIASCNSDRVQTITPVSTVSSRCTQCSARSKGDARNLVVCIDGTSNEFGQNNTNVVKLFAQVDLESTHPEQRAYYSSGVGTRPKSQHAIDRWKRAITDKFDTAIAWNQEEIVKEAYGWLAQTYQEGDCIYFFGFSRGAYQVRVLAGMIHEVGLIRTLTEKQIATVYGHYEATRSGEPEAKQTAREFKNTFAWNHLKVHFIGVWDTVSSVGLIRGDVFLSGSSSAEHACYFRHALALDELRVKFIPEYFHEMNCQTDDVKSRYIRSSTDVGHDEATGSGRRESTVTDNNAHLSTKTNDRVKEVWFAGSHSDVGGRNRPGKVYQAGNASLLWMRREATSSGLKLKPTDIVWVPDDLDFGTSNSMSGAWHIIEYIPIKHQVSFSGTNDDVRRAHRFQPRRIIPGQKVHASILHANAYKPQASLGEGFDIPLMQVDFDIEPDPRLWETGMFDDTAAQQLVDYLDSEQGVASIHLDRLLFMLQFREGRQSVRSVSDWQARLVKLIHRSNCAPLVRLVAVAAYYEASCDPDVHHTCPALPQSETPRDIFAEAKESLRAVLTTHKHRDGPRAFTLLRPLTKHGLLRERILTEDTLEVLIELLDVVLSQNGVSFGQAMDGLTCLLQCEHTRETITKKLDVARITKILSVNESPLLTAALRMVMVLARSPMDGDVCSVVKQRLRQLASKDEGLVGLLAIETLLALYVPNEPGQLDISKACVRTNLARALSYFNLGQRSSGNGQGSMDPAQQVLHQLFGIDAPELNDGHKKLIGELRQAIMKGYTRERTAATLTLLRLCESQVIRTYLCDIHLLNAFLDQLQYKAFALLAAYALATCLKYPDMKASVINNELLPKNIVGMLRLDYFDDAVGPVEGFQIFGDLMQHADLRDKINNYNITKVLNTKLETGRPKETRTSLICLDIFQFFDRDGPWTHKLVDKALKCLQNPEWQVQKAGVTILSSLAQTQYGVDAICLKIDKIVEMLLPERFTPITSTVPETITVSPASLGDSQARPTADATNSELGMVSLADVPSKPSSWMLGPACALRVLAQNKTLRDIVRKTVQYDSLNNLHMSGMLVSEVDTRAWRVKTPNRADVTDMLDKMIKVVDGELLEEGLMSIGDTVLPHIEHWDRLAAAVRQGAGKVASALPALLGVSILAILTMTLFVPVYYSFRAFGFLKRKRVRGKDARMLNTLREERSTAVVPHGGTDLGVPGGEGTSGGHSGGEGVSQGVGDVVNVDAETLADAANP